MLLDLRHFQMKMETLTRLRPLPDAALVETYIKAFYLPETALDEFVQQHTVKR
jgi:syndetin